MNLNKIFKWLCVGVLIATPTIGKAAGVVIPPKVVNVSSLPATCTVGGPLYQKTSVTVGLYECTATNTLTLVGPGSGGITQAAADLRYFMLDGSNTGTGNISTISTGLLRFGSNSYKYTDGTGPTSSDNTTGFNTIWNVQLQTGNRVFTLPNVSGTVALISSNVATATALAADPTDCTTPNFSRGINASGVAKCAQPAFTELSDTASSAQIPNNAADTTGKSAKTDALNSATTVINVSSATAPSSGQVLTSTSSTTATWQTPSAGGSAPFSDAGAIVKNASDATKLILLDASGMTTGNTISVFYSGTSAAPIWSIGATGRIAFGVTSSDVAVRKGSVTVAGTPTMDFISGNGGGSASTNAGRYIVGGCTTCVIDQFSSETSIVNTGESAYEPLRLGFARFFGTGQTSVKAVVSYIASGVVGIGTSNEGDHNGWVVDGGECFVASDQTLTTTTLTSTTCGVTVTSGRKYSGVCELFLSDSVAADGAKIDFDGGSATATNFRAQVTAFDSALNLSTQLTSLTSTASATTFTGAGAFEVHFSFEPSSTGTLLTRFAQAGHTTGTLTLARGSFCAVRDTP